MDLEALLVNPPLAHGAPASPYAMGIDEEVLRVIDAHVHEGTRTLETGAGVSTALFAIKGARHTCVVPSEVEIDRVRSWCAQTGVGAEAISFFAARSEELLPTLDPTPLDLVLIDGGHGFPAPFIDWFYAGRRLCLGGVLIVDDTQLWTGAVLKRFLIEQPGWEMIATVPMRSAVFRRTDLEDLAQEWVHQPFVTRRSWVGGARGKARSAVRLGHLLRTRNWSHLRDAARR